MPPEAEATPQPTPEPVIATGPALSATSDVPTAAPGPPLSDEVNTRERDQNGRFVAKPVDNAAEGGETEGTGDPAPGDATTTAAPKPDKTPLEEKEFMRRAREATRAANERAARAEARIAALETAARPPEPAPAPRPQRDAFSDPDAYDAALIEWSGKQAAAKAVAEADQKRISEARAAQAKSLTDTWREHKEAFVADHPDYEEVAEATDETGKDLVPISVPMAHAIMTAGKDGPAISYYLGQNREESARISKLEPVQASVEIGRIAAKLANPTPTPRTKPAPLTPLRSRSNASAKDPSEMTTEEYAASIAHRLPYGRKTEARPN